MSQHTPWGHASRVPCGGWRGAVPPRTPPGRAPGTWRTPRSSASAPRAGAPRQQPQPARPLGVHCPGDRRGATATPRQPLRVIRRVGWLSRLSCVRQACPTQLWTLRLNALKGIRYLPLELLRRALHTRSQNIEAANRAMGWQMGISHLLDTLRDTESGSCRSSPVGFRRLRKRVLVGSSGIPLVGHFPLHGTANGKERRAAGSGAGEAAKADDGGPHEPAHTLAIERNISCLHQFILWGSPRALAEDDREAPAEHLGGRPDLLGHDRSVRRGARPNRVSACTDRRSSCVRVPCDDFQTGCAQRFVGPDLPQAHTLQWLIGSADRNLFIR